MRVALDSPFVLAATCVFGAILLVSVFFYTRRLAAKGCGACGAK